MPAVLLDDCFGGVSFPVSPLAAVSFFSFPSFEGSESLLFPWEPRKSLLLTHHEERGRWSSDLYVTGGPSAVRVLSSSTPAHLTAAAQRLAKRLGLPLTEESTSW